MICNRHDAGELCGSCSHGKEHERVRHCGYSKCIVYSIAFGIEQGDCLHCAYRDNCKEYDQLIFEGKPVINLLTHGDYCPEYRRRYLYAKCVKNQ